jgi:hypothetical protein
MFQTMVRQLLDELDELADADADADDGAGSGVARVAGVAGVAVTFDANGSVTGAVAEIDGLVEDLNVDVLAVVASVAVGGAAFVAAYDAKIAVAEVVPAALVSQNVRRCERLRRCRSVPDGAANAAAMRLDAQRLSQ